MKKEVMQEVAQLCDFDEMLYKVSIYRYNFQGYMRIIVLVAL